MQRELMRNMHQMTHHCISAGRWRTLALLNAILAVIIFNWGTLTLVACTKIAATCERIVSTTNWRVIVSVPGQESVGGRATRLALPSDGPSGYR
jgi:hypothetical protein